MAISNRMAQGAQNTRVNNTYQSQPRQQYNQNVGGGDMYNLNTNMGMTRQQPQYNTQQQGRGGGLPGQQGRPTYDPMPLPGSPAQERPGSGQGDYYNPQYPQYRPQNATGNQAQANQFSYYQGLDPYTLQSNDEREAALQAVQANVPIWQLGQNSYQYAQDFNEAQRRWNEQFNYQQGLDQFNMGLSSRQQQMAEWQAQQANNQWAADFARQTGNDAWQQQFSQQQFGLQDYQTRTQLQQQQQMNDWQQRYQQGQLDTGNRELDIRNQYQQGQLQQGNRQLDIQQELNRGNIAQGNRQLDIQQQLGLGNLDIQRQQNTINEAYNQGRLSNEARQIALAELTQQQNFHIQNFQNDLAQGRLDVERGQLGVAQQANQIDQMYKSGQLDLGQRNAALAELTQSQTYAMQQAQLGQQQTEQARRFSLDYQTQAQLNAYRNQELAQQAMLAREQMAAQQQQALLAATGRNQRANVRWMRSS